MTKLNFRIVEGSSVDNIDMEEFTRDYMDLTVSKQEILDKYDLTNGQYYKRIKRIKDETGFCRPRGYNPNKQYPNRIMENDSGTYRIVKHFYTKHNVQSTRSVTVPDYETALKVRELLDECNWEEDAVQEIRDKYGVRRGFSARSMIHSPVKSEALTKYDEFKELYFDKSLRIVDIRDRLGLTRWQYTCLKNELEHEYPNLGRRVSA